MNPQQYTFVPDAIENLIPICSAGLKFLTNLRHRLAPVPGDSRKTKFLFQMVFILIQTFNQAQSRQEVQASSRQKRNGFTCMQTM